MFKPFTFFLVYLVSCYGIVAAYAQDECTYYVGFSTNYVIENIDDDQTKDKFIGRVKTDFDNTWGINFKGGFILNEYFTAEGRFQYISKSDSELCDCYDSEIDAMNVSLNPKVTFPLFDYFIPYGFIGFGIMNAYEKISGVQNNKESDWGISSQLGFGADLPVLPNIALNGEIFHVFGFGNVDHISYSLISVGAAYRF